MVCALLGSVWARMVAAQEALPDSPGFRALGLQAEGQLAKIFGGVTGTVTDRSGTVVAGARVVLTEAANGRTQETMSMTITWTS